MALPEDLLSSVQEIFRASWEIRGGRVVPDTDSLTLGNKGVQLNATVLYADIRNSTSLVDSYSPQAAAEVYKTFLWCAGRLVERHGGTITAYDGDRIMAVFIGGSKNTSAARCALAIHWAVAEVINPVLRATYGIFGPYTIQHSVGVDTSVLLAAKTGVRGANDLVWVGRAANHAAKLCTLEQSHPTFITADVFNVLHPTLKFSLAAGELMWEPRLWPAMNNRPIYRSGWWWRP